MRQIDLYLDRPNGQFVQGINAANPVAALRVTQNETLDIRIHNAVRNTAVPALTPFVERPVEFSSIRASIGNIDHAPRSGSFKLRISGQTTAQINWTSPTTPGAVTAFKASVLAALHALSNVDPAELIAVDPPDSPAHILYFQWANNRTDEIEVVDVKLLPWIAPEVTPGQTAAGYTQSVKLSQAPFVIATAFEREDAPLPTIVETRPGALGTNAEQTLIIPAASMGSLSLSWDGATTKTMAAGTVTAAGIAGALNAIVASGATAPRFRVEERPARDARRFAIEFIGALSGASQPLLTVAAHDQEPLLFARGVVNLDGKLGIEQALNGAASVSLKFELVISAPDGPEKFIIPIEIVNDMTNEGTLATLEEIGAVLTVTHEVFVDLGTAEAFADVAAGVSYALPATAVSSTFVIPRTFNDKHPDVSASYRSVDSPETWIDFDDNLYIATHTSETSTTVSLLKPDGTARPVNIATPAHADYATRFKFFFAARDPRVMLFTHKHTWDDVLDTLPAGQSLRAKLAALEAGLGQLDGSLKMPPTSLDLPALIAALVALIKSDATMRVLFTDLLTTLITDASIIRAIAKELAKYSEFIETLKTCFANEELLNSLFEQLTKSLAFEEYTRALVLETLQGGAGTLPPGTVIFDVPTFEFIYPPAQEIPAPATISAGVEDVETTTVNGGTTTKTSGKTSVTKTQANTSVRYDLLSPAFREPTSGGTITGDLPATAPLGEVYVVTGTARSRTVSTRRGRDWKADQKITFENKHWFQVQEGNSHYYPVEMEAEVHHVPVGDRMLDPLDAEFNFQWLTQASLAGNVRGFIDIVAEISAGSAPEEIFRHTISLSKSASLHQFAMKLKRAPLNTVGTSGVAIINLAKSTVGLGTLQSITILTGPSRDALVFQGFASTVAELQSRDPAQAFYTITESATHYVIVAQNTSNQNIVLETSGDDYSNDGAAPSALSCTYSIYGQDFTAALSARVFALRVRTERFRYEPIDDSEPRGSMKIKSTATASISRIS